MKCPKCKSTLIVGGQDRYESLSEHVSNPNGIPSLKTYFVCNNSECVCFNKVNWLENGETFGGYRIFNNGELTAPFGSYERQLEVEIYKRSINGPLKSKTYLSSWLTLKFFKPYIEYYYTSNYDGEILKRTFYLKILKYEGKESFWKRKEKKYCLGAQYCWVTWQYLWKTFWRDYSAERYVKAFSTGYNDAWTYRWFHAFVKTVFHKKYKSVVDQVFICWKTKTINY